MKTDIERVKEYLISAGGAAEFHTLNDLCLSVTGEGEVVRVVRCKVTDDNPFGVKDAPHGIGPLQMNDLIVIVKEEMLKKKIMNKFQKITGHHFYEQAQVLPMKLLKTVQTLNNEFGDKRQYAPLFMNGDCVKFNTESTKVLAARTL